MCVRERERERERERAREKERARERERVLGTLLLSSISPKGLHLEPTWTSSKFPRVQHLERAALTDAFLDFEQNQSTADVWTGPVRGGKESRAGRKREGVRAR